MSWRPILVGVDGSPESAYGATFGAAIARRAGTACRLLHVTEDYTAALSAPEVGVDFDALSQAAEASARRLVDQSLETAVPLALRQTLDVRVGRAAAVLAETARDIGAEVVVLGGKRRRAFARLAGSTVTNLVRISKVPVLATETATQTITRVLVAVDLSYAAKPAIDVAERWAALFGARLRVLHAVEPMPVIPGFNMPVAQDEVYRSAQQQVDTAIAPLVAYAGAEIVVRPGRAAAAIATEAGQWRADLIILGSHGKGWVDRLLIGSTSERLLQVLPAPVLVVPVAHPGLRVESAGARHNRSVPLPV